MLVINRFGMEFPRLAAHLSNQQLLDLGEIMHCQDFAYLYFDEPKKKKFYHQRTQLLRAIRHGYHEYKQCRLGVANYLIEHEDIIKRRLPKIKK